MGEFYQGGIRRARLLPLWFYPLPVIKADYRKKKKKRAFQVAFLFVKS